MKERCRDGCRTSLLIAGAVLVPAIFHTLLPPCHPYITIHFMEMIFSTLLIHFSGVASGMASRALALLDFWLAGPIEPTFQRVFLALLLDYWSDHFPMADSGGVFGFSLTARAYA